MQIARVLTDTTHATIASVRTFWFGAPAQDTPALLMKFQRWYQGGAEMDSMIRARFGELIEQALARELDDWQASLEGRLALVLLLDQFTRNVFRGSPRAYAGDPAALALALDLLDGGDYAALSVEERLFAVMPLVHAEDLALQTRAVALARDLVLAAPAALRDAWRLGHQRTELYRSIIARFGRFPQRNAILGRSSTPEEREFLARPEPAPALAAEHERTRD